MLAKSKTLAFAIALVAFLGSAAYSAPILVVWDGAGTTTDGGTFDFENGTKLFPGFSSNQLASITGSGIYHNHTFPSSNQTVNFDILLNGVWTNLYSVTWPAGSSSNFNLLSMPISFPDGIVSGIRFTSSPASFNTFHFSSNLTFAFIQTPEPASMLAWGLIAGVGAVGYRLRKRKAAAVA